MHILCPTFGYIAQTIQKKQLAFYGSNVGIAKIILTKLMFIL
jgi:hypothetical protein